MTAVEVLLSAPGLPRDTRVFVETTWLGEDRRVPLVDDGSVPGDAPADALYVARLEGEAVRLLAVRLVVAPPGEPEHVAWEGVEDIRAEGDRLSFREAPGERFQRVAGVAYARDPVHYEAASALAAAGWALVVFVYVAWLVRERLR